MSKERDPDAATAMFFFTLSNTGNVAPLSRQAEATSTKSSHVYVDESHCVRLRTTLAGDSIRFDPRVGPANFAQAHARILEDPPRRCVEFLHEVRDRSQRTDVYLAAGSLGERAREQPLPAVGGSWRTWRRHLPDERLRWPEMQVAPNSSGLE